MRFIREDIYSVVSLESCIDQRDVAGGTSTNQVKRQSPIWRLVNKYEIYIFISCNADADRLRCAAAGHKKGGANVTKTRL